MQQNKTASQRKTINPACWVPTAYFAMGLPFIAINLVSVFMFKDLGISDTQIAFWTSLIMMPWTLKFLWSPFLEMYRTKKFFVLITELLSGVLFGVVAFSLFFDYFFAISISTMAVIAFSGATHDIACDGVYMAELNKEDQAKYIGVQGAFYNVAKLVANGGLVAMAGALAEHFGAIEGASIDANKGAYSSAWMIIFGVIAAIMVLIGIYHIKMLPSTQVPSTTKKTASEVGHELVAVIANFFTKKHILYYICFIILYRLAEGFIMKIAPLFLRASRDVIRYCKSLCADPDALPEDFWSNSSGNEIVRRFIDKADIQTKNEIERLISGECIEKEIVEELTYNELDKSIENLWSVLFTTGYLTQQGRTQNGKYLLSIPNTEIRNLFTKKIKEWFSDVSKNDGKTLEIFCNAFIEKKPEKIEQLFGDYLWNTISIRDTAIAKEKKENFYHGILLGLLGYKSSWLIKSNAESGIGYSDILIEAPENRTGIVIELKYAEDGDMDAACKQALKQIEDKDYIAKLKQDGMRNFIKYGVACYKKDCKVMIYEE